MRRDQEEQCVSITVSPLEMTRLRLVPAPSAQVLHHVTLPRCTHTLQLAGSEMSAYARHLTHQSAVWWWRS